MAFCLECREEVNRITKCLGCEARLCPFCYQMHRDARYAGDGCIFHMMSVIEKRVGLSKITTEQYLAALSENQPGTRKGKGRK